MAFSAREGSRICRWSNADFIAKKVLFEQFQTVRLRCASLFFSPLFEQEILNRRSEVYSIHDGLWCLFSFDR